MRSEKGMKRALRECLNLRDFERTAMKALPRPIYGYIRAYAEDGRAFYANQASFERYQLINNVLVDASARDPSVKLFGHRYAQPFGMAPVGLSALYTYRGDCALAAAAAQSNIPMVLSSSSLIPLEEVIEANPQAWFQAYIPGDWDKLAPLIERVLRAQYRVLVITVDTPVNPNKENYIRYGFSSPLKLSVGLVAQGLLHPRWLVGTLMKTLLRHGVPHFENNYAERGVSIFARNVERSFADRGKLTWKDLARVREIWPHRLVVKGLLNPDDVIRAVDAGADGVILSNHGGRQLDGAVAPLTVLPAVRRRHDALPIMLDGGIRRGTDVLKAIALGADAVFLGRPFAYAAATGARQGIDRLIALLAGEIDRDLAMLGKENIAEINSRALWSTDTSSPIHPAGR